MKSAPRAIVIASLLLASVSPLRASADACFETRLVDECRFEIRIKDHCLCDPEKGSVEVIQVDGDDTIVGPGDFLGSAPIAGPHNYMVKTHLLGCDHNRLIDVTARLSCRRTGV
jgi:hypothetical protein